MMIEWYMTAMGAHAAAFYVTLIIIHINVLKSWLNTFR